MAIPHIDPLFFEPDDVEEMDAEYMEYAAELERVTAGVGTGEDSFLEEQYEDMTSGTMFDTLDD